MTPEALMKALDLVPGNIHIYPNTGSAAYWPSDEGPLLNKEEEER